MKNAETRNGQVQVQICAIEKCLLNNQKDKYETHSVFGSKIITTKANERVKPTLLPIGHSYSNPFKFRNFLIP